jgi:hypothetical protein
MQAEGDEEAEEVVDDIAKELLELVVVVLEVVELEELDEVDDEVNKLEVLLELEVVVGRTEEDVVPTGSGSVQTA